MMVVWWDSVNLNRTDYPHHRCSAQNFCRWLSSLPDFRGFVGSVLSVQPVRGSVLNSSASFHGGCSWFMNGSSFCVGLKTRTGSVSLVSPPPTMVFRGSGLHGRRVFSRRRWLIWFLKASPALGFSFAVVLKKTVWLPSGDTPCFYWIIRLVMLLSWFVLNWFRCLFTAFRVCCARKGRDACCALLLQGKLVREYVCVGGRLIYHDWKDGFDFVQIRLWFDYDARDI